jgi:hypothetical protein
VADQPDTLALISRSQQGDEAATEKLLTILRDEHMPRRIRRHLKRNVLVEEAEIQSEWLIGCWKAIRLAKLDVGNPLMFICWKGDLQVIHLFRKKIRDGVKVSCQVCGIVPMAFRKTGFAAVAGGKRAGTRSPIACSKCGSIDVDTFMTTVDESQQSDEIDATGAVHAWDRIDPDHVHEHMDELFSDITYDIQVQEIRAKLNGRVLQLFDKLVIEQINRDTSKNYLEEIATEWGVSTACVSVYLRKLREKVLAYIETTKLQVA